MSHSSSHRPSILLVFFLILFCSPGIAQVAPILGESLILDVTVVEEAIRSESLETAAVVSASALSVWKDNHNFLELVRYTKRAYDRRAQDDLNLEYERRLAVPEGTPTWVEWTDRGLLALVLQRVGDASECFSRAIQDPEAGNLAFLRSMLSGCLLRLNDLDGAEREYAAAIRAASQQPPSVFRIKYEFTQGLYETGRVSKAFSEEEPIQVCLASSYPMERVFGLYESLIHAWWVDSATDTQNRVQELQSLLATAQPRSDSVFEIRRFDEAENLVSRILAARSGDDITAMILAEESTWFGFKTKDFQPILDRLRPWKEKYPIEAYPTWDTNLRFAALSVHSAYNRASSLIGNATEAVNGFQSVLNTIPPEEEPQLVASSHCWLSTHLQDTGQYQEALDHVTAGLAILPATSTYREVYQTHLDSITRLKNDIEGIER